MAALPQQTTPTTVDSSRNGPEISLDRGLERSALTLQLGDAARRGLGPPAITDPIKERIEASRDASEIAILLTQNRDDPNLALAAAERIVKYGDARCATALTDYLLRKGQNEDHLPAVKKCAEAMRYLALEGDVTPSNLYRALRPLMGSGESALREGVLLTLGEQGHPDALGELARIRTDPAENPEFRLEALRLLPEGHQGILERMLEEKLPVQIEAKALWSLYGREGKYRDAAMHRLRSEKTSPELQGALILNGSSRAGLVGDEMIVAACASSDFTLSCAGTFAALMRAEKNGPQILRQALGASENGVNSQGALLGALADCGALEDRTRFEKLLNTKSSGIERDAAFRYFSRVDPEVAVAAARQEIHDETVGLWGSGAVEVLLANGDPSDDRLIIDTIGELSPYTDLDRAIAASERYGRTDLLSSIPAPVDPNESHGYRKIVRALARSGDEVAVAELLNTPYERFERGEKAVALAQSPVKAALESIHGSLSKSDMVVALPIAHEIATKPDAYARFVSNLAATGEPKLTAWADDLIRAKTLGIESPLRLRPEDLHHIIETRRSVAPPQDGERQALVVLPRSDHNKAFYGVGPAIASLREQGYRVVLYEASNENDVQEALSAHTRYGSSDFIMLAAHGTRDTMSFGGVDPALGIVNDERLALDLSDKSQFKSAEIRGALKNGGHVMLLSCSTGEGGERARNMANMMREIFPQAKEDGISAPPIPVRAGFPLEFDDAGHPVQLKQPWLRFYLTEASGNSLGPKPPLPT